MRRISPAVLWSVFGALALAIVIAVLAAVGAANPKTNWTSFLPDLIVGFVTAAVVGAILAAVQHHFEARRRYDEQVSAAYDRLLEAVAPLRQIRFNDVVEATLIHTVTTRMIQLGELVDRHWPDILAWFEAERQLMLYRAEKAVEAGAALVAARTPYTADDVLKAGDPFYRWAADFGDNLRFWRTGRMTGKEMRTQSATIEAELRKVGFWRTDHDWRDKKGGEKR